MPQTRLIRTSRLVGGSVFVLCLLLAIFLFRQQASVAATRDRDLRLWRESADLEECLADLNLLLESRVEQVAPLDQRLKLHMSVLGGLSRSGEERRLVAAMEDQFARYRDLKQHFADPLVEARLQAIEDAAEVISADWIGICQQLRRTAYQRLSDGAHHHRLVLRELAWGMVALGCLGGLGGGILGYTMARSVQQSVHRIQVHVRDAAGKLSPDSPSIELSGVGDLGRLQDQVEDLVRRIETNVRALQEREQAVRRADQFASMGQLAAGVAHELRNPLTAIKLLVQSGLENPGGDRLDPEWLRVIEGEIRRMERSLQGFMDLARPPRPEKRKVDVPSLLIAVANLVRSRAERQSVQIVLELGLLSFEIHGDPEHIRQVFLNLMLNALDAMPHGGVLNVSIRSTTNRIVRIRFADTGPGVDPKARDRLFEPFFSTKETGLGMGLVISRRIVEDHGGELELDAESTSGVAFEVRLPLLSEPAVEPVECDTSCC